MTLIQVPKERQRLLVERRGIVTVPGEFATLACQGRPLTVSAFPLSHRSLYNWFYEIGKKFIARQQVRGLEYYDKEGIHIYGPYPSYEFKDHLLDIGGRAIDPVEAASLIRDRDTSVKAYADYLLVAKFVAQTVPTEVIVKEG